MHAFHRHHHRRRTTTRSGFIIQSPRQNAGRGGFADPAHTGQNPGLRNPSRCKGIGQRPHHGFLTDQIIKGLRPVFARKHAIMGLGCGLRLEARQHRTIGLRIGTVGRGGRLIGNGHERKHEPLSDQNRTGLSEPARTGFTLERPARWEAGRRPARSR